MERKTLFYLIVGLQILFLLGMISMKQSTVLFGQKILLKPVPIDPTDPFRGDYVTISYEISRLDLSILPPDVKGGDTLYVSLQNTGEYWGAAFADRKRHGGIELKGVVNYVSGNEAWVEYPIDSYFVPKGEGTRDELRDFEKLLVEVRVWGSDAVITSILYDGKPIEFSTP